MSLRDEALAQGLTEQEFERIVSMLGREPNSVELGIVAVMWSEHCSYKTTRKYLKTLPTQAPWVIHGPGENAGVIDIGDQYALVFKVESHNHPSFIEPFQGAATGVGGILRDVFTMGARPMAVMDSLHFGAVDHPRTPFLFHGVVGGISHYGNCMGIPNVGGETHFDACYNGNNLVNAMALGVCKKDQIYTAQASTVGLRVLYLGSKTGKDGIHGATMASEEFTDESQEKRPTVQVGDPFMEKLVMEATLEMLHGGLVEGIQDMGAAGIACSTFELASNGGLGMNINLDRIPLREEDTSAYEIFLSESQERMLMVTTEDRLPQVFEIAKKWGVDCVDVGEVTDTGKVEAFYHGEKVVDMPVHIVSDGAQELDRPWHAPTVWSETKDLNACTMSDSEAVELYLSHIASASRKPIYQQYDHTVGSDTLLHPGADAAVMRVKGCKSQVAVTLDSHHKYCKADPHQGMLHVMAECYRNLSTVGAKALAMTNCLNFGNPEEPEIMGQLVHTIAGIKEAAEKLQTPVTGGNVSMYNQTNGQNIDPTPTIGMVGVVKHQQSIKPYFTTSDRQILLVGQPRLDAFYQSEFSRIVLQQETLGLPPVDLEAEIRLQAFMRAAYLDRIIDFGRDISRGGLFQTLIECVKHDGYGAAIDLPCQPEQRLAYLFHETNACMLIVLDPQKEDDLMYLARKHQLPVSALGKVRGKALSIKDVVDFPIDQLVARRQTPLETL
jgi:phosphoribosylformylglycinamidine synthase